MADVDSLVGDRLALMDLEYRRNRHELVELSLERAIRDRVLEKEAAARGLTLEAFVSQLSEGRVEVTEEDVVNFYRRNMGAFGGRRLEDMYDQIVEYLEDRGNGLRPLGRRMLILTAYKTGILCRPRFEGGNPAGTEYPP